MREMGGWIELTPGNRTVLRSRVVAYVRIPIAALRVQFMVLVTHTHNAPGLTASDEGVADNKHALERDICRAQLEAREAEAVRSARYRNLY